jgi:hypothetical protein
MICMAVIGTAKTLALSCLTVVELVKLTVSLSAEVVATVRFSENAPLLKNLAESDDRNVEVLSKTVTLVEPVLRGSGELSGDEAEGREVVALAEALERPKACTFVGRQKTPTVRKATKKSIRRVPGIY